MFCKNCQTELKPTSNYCYNCGGKIIKNRLSLKNLFTHISETFFNYDNKLLRTFIDLFKKPEAVIESYVDGVRKRYVNPLSFFGISLTLNGLGVFIIKKFYLQYFDYSKFFSSDIYNNPVSKQIMENSSNSAFEYNSLIYSVMIPVMAIISFIVFFNKRYNFTEHITIYLYSMSALSVVSLFIGQFILLIAPEKYLTFIFLFYIVMLVYHLYTLKRIFKLNIKQLVIKTLFFFVVFLTLYFIFSILLVFFMFISGDINIGDMNP